MVLIGMRSFFDRPKLNLMAVKEENEVIEEESECADFVLIRQSDLCIGQIVGRNLDCRENFDIAVARAVEEMRVLGIYLQLGHDPQFVLFAGGSCKELFILVYMPHRKFGQRTAIICLNDGRPPGKYPRAPGIPSKLPL
ncbi:hypothetical protein SASPL_157700 [Salvia splendens]|uniref:Uncharacterized protein n=1 Tax=Salvia splendens TaxID=180675 RepID=A0A8X8YW04_SALSN|nr:hypothetical protein SASPL_157700 [Salvia splendens]